MKKIGCFALSVCLGISAPVLVNANQDSKDEHSPHIYIFVSFSMPKTSLKQWLLDAKRVDAPVLLQGLIDNSIQKTTREVLALTQKNEVGVQIDPTAFARFHITAVPAVVVTNKTACLPQQSCPPDYDVVTGNTSLLAAMETIAHGQTKRAAFAQRMVHRLQGKSV